MREDVAADLLLLDIKDYPTGRYLRDARLYAVGAGTQEIRRMLIGREFNEEILGKGKPT